MTRFALLLFLTLLLTPAAPAPLAAHQPPAGGAAMDEYVPVAELPPDEQLPAVPLVLFAYAFIWMTVLVYVFALWRRLGKLQKELDSVQRQLRS